jgi:hypothetical protein
MSIVAVDLVEAARSSGGQVFVPSRHERIHPLGSQAVCNHRGGGALEKLRPLFHSRRAWDPRAMLKFDWCRSQSQ